MLNTLDHENIFDCINHFDFDKVVKVMQFLNWKWLDGGEDYPGTMAVPTPRAVRKTVYRMLTIAAESAKAGGRDTDITCGGFRVRAAYEEGKLYLSIEFILESQDNYD